MRLPSCSATTPPDSALGYVPKGETFPEGEALAERLVVGVAGAHRAGLGIDVGHDVQVFAVPGRAEHPFVVGKQAERARLGAGAEHRDRQLAAVDELLEVGYHGTTMRRIAARSGVSVPAIYGHYESKQAILVRILDDALTDLEWRTAAAVS